MQFARIALSCLVMLSVLGTAWADTAKGRIKYVSKKANTIQLVVKGKEPVVVRFDDKTVFENAKGIAELGPPDLLSVEFEPGQPASKIKKIVFGLPPGVEIDTEELLATLQGKRGQYVLGDARPPKKFETGHIPSAVSTFPKDKEAFLKALPADKGRLLVFYCGGPTCPFTGKAVDLAKANGYTNLRGYQMGIPAWKKSKLAVHSEPGWLAKNLDEHHVIIDARDSAVSAKRHIKSAVAIPASELAAMTRRFIKEQKLAELPGVRDKRAPIIIYADSHTSREALLGYRQLRDWGYGNATVLSGGLKAWVAEGRPVASGPMPTSVTYSKKLVKGAIAPTEFITLEKSRQGVVFVDVRTDAEIASHGMLKDAMHIPLDYVEASLAKLPRDKEIVVYCKNGIRAEMAYETLRDNGFKTRFLNETPTFHKDGSMSL